MGMGPLSAHEHRVGADHLQLPVRIRDLIQSGLVFVDPIDVRDPELEHVTAPQLSDNHRDELIAGLVDEDLMPAGLANGLAPLSCGSFA